MKRLFSGIQPTGNIHLGNYLGAITNWVKMQYEYESLFCIVDLHAITVPQNPSQLKKSIIDLAIYYIACGIDPEKSIIYPQSMVRGHSELGWILSCVTQLGWLDRMTQFKDKSGKDQKRACLGLYAYPVLQAADILLYHTEVVPVGEDQKQHIELARDIAGSFNRHVEKEYFKLPEPKILGAATRVMSLKDGLSKMSKSDPSDYSRINLNDDVDTIAKKFKKAKTDSIETIYYNKENRPEVSNLINIYAALSDISLEKANNHFDGKNGSFLKQELINVAIDKLSPVVEKVKYLQNDHQYIENILLKSSERANVIAEKTMTEVRNLIGLYRS